MLVLAMEFSRGSLTLATRYARTCAGQARGRRTLDAQRGGRLRRRDHRTQGPVSLPQNGTEVPALHCSAPRETYGLQPRRCSGGRVASDRHRSFQAEMAQTVTP
jgi:hypothetical protein